MSLMSRLSERRNSEFSKVGEYTIPFSKLSVLRIYADTKPCMGEIADLQKGLIFVYTGVERVGEGTGFGVPIVIKSGETYFSGTSRVYVSRQDDAVVVRKEFLMEKSRETNLRMSG